MSDPRVINFACFVAGAAACLLVSDALNKKTGRNDGASAEGKDLSLFYGDEKELTTITDSRKFLPSDVYGELVRKCVVCCVDIVVVRRDKETGKKQCVLVERASEPAKGVWWWPGGRLLKGETFFDAAKRKTQQETGLKSITPIQVLGVWNTFFPASAWDSQEEKGTQTVNAIVLVELGGDDNDIVLDAQSERWRWIGLDPEEAKANSEDRYVIEALERLDTWNPSYKN
ncbi:unnamed protein product [Cylindrotheca closterium]|uniref:Nudix hydrolase domain-containing protein n=1 Tax=Cylindrotheca closterium TaxID=2856 RepID=A0AAD2G270_9STRA|nr:unnamed protein product [Cylindrotheca closterium]